MVARPVFDPWESTPQQASYARRSKYLAALLDANQQAAEEIQSPAELGVRLLAQALTQWGADKTERKQLEARSTAYKSQGDAIAKQLELMGAGANPNTSVPAAPNPVPQETMPAPPRPPVQSAPLPPAQPSKPEETAFRFFTGKGYTPQQAAGIVGNLIAESDLNPTALNAKEGSTGIAQWRLDRRAGLEREFGPKPPLDKQLEYVIKELQGPEANADKALRGANDPAAAAAAFAGFERPAGWAPGGDPSRISNWGRRSGEAQRLFSTYGNVPGRDVTQIAAGPEPEEVAPLPQAPAQPFQVAQNGGPVPVPQQPQQQPPLGAQGYGFVTPEMKAMVVQAAQSGQPAMIQWAQQQLAEWQMKAAEQAKREVTTVNGLPGLIDPISGKMQMAQLPPEARSRVVSAQEAGIQAPPGTMVELSPTGGARVVYQPPAGQQVQTPPGAPYREQPVAGGANDPTSPMNRVSGEKQLRSEYDQQIKPYVEARNGYSKVLAAAQDGTGASDIALIFGFMKTLDPTSTVREGEFATAQNSGSVDQTLMNLYNRALKGERLQPEQRAQFAQTAGRQFGVYQQQADLLNQRYSGLAQSNGLDPRNVVTAFPQITAASGEKGAPNASGYTEAQQKAIQSYKGVRDPQTGKQYAFGDERNPYVPKTQADYDRLPAGSWFIDSDGELTRKGRR